MLYWIIQITLISVILIFLVHHLIHFFKTTLTVPKIKDLVNSPTQKYESMFNIIKHSQSNDNNYIDIPKNEEYTMIDLLPQPDEKTMKSELKNFLKKQLNTSNNNTNNSISNINTNNNQVLDISAINSMNTYSYSEYK
jgi:hypothetical protein